MSNALAISGVTSVLQYYLNLAYHQSKSVLGSVSVTAVAPDIVQTSQAGGPSLQVNLFLHQVTHNAAWRNIGFPSLSSDGANRLNNPPLALDLHYLLTAYGFEDTQAEALLGYGVLFLHQNPVLARADITTALSNLPSGNPYHTSLSGSGLADQIEMVKITPAVLGKEEMAWLWTALKADYRPTYPFQVSVVLIEPQASYSFSLPVLSRGITVQPGPPPQLFSIQVPKGQSAPMPGDTVTVSGISLSGVSQVMLTYPRLGIRYGPVVPTQVTNTSFTIKVPDDAANFPAGVYTIEGQFTNASHVVIQSTTTLPFPVSTKLTFGAGAAKNNTEGTLVTATCDPWVWPNQTVSLSLNGNAVPAVIFDKATQSPTFQFPTLAAGSYLGQLVVDGVTSQMTINPGPPPTFAGPTLTV